jgi:hypothetical protein
MQPDSIQNIEPVKVSDDRRTARRRHGIRIKRQNTYLLPVREKGQAVLKQESGARIQESLGCGMQGTDAERTPFRSN